MNEVLELVNTLAHKERTFTEYEAQLYEAAARYAATLLKVANMSAQIELLEVERELDDLRNSCGNTT